jgi:hypothetical protein
MVLDVPKKNGPWSPTARLRYPGYSTLQAAGGSAASCAAAPVARAIAARISNVSMMTLFVSTDRLGKSMIFP